MLAVLDAAVPARELFAHLRYMVDDRAHSHNAVVRWYPEPQES